MIIGNCPYCETVFLLPIGDRSPNLQKHTCEDCEQTIWTFCSRLLDPVSYTVDAFNKEFEVDEERSTFRRKKQ